jgi:lysophospholipase L1-like esterase
LFDAYVATIEELRRARPALVIAHVTVPLGAIPSRLGSAALTFIGRRPPQLSQNAARHEFNERLRDRFAPVEPLFDLAAIEAGGRVHPPALDRRFTDDGGHLNARGRRRVAGAFVEFLERLASSRR